MSIINTLLGGTDCTASTVLKATDLNDTFNAAVNIIKGTIAFWMNSYTRTLFDDFSSYTAGSTIVSAKYATSSTYTPGSGIGNTYSMTWKGSATNNASSNSHEGNFSVSCSNSNYQMYFSGTLTISTFTANTHKRFRIYSTAGRNVNGNGGDVQISFDGASTYNTINTATTSTNTQWCDVLIVAKGSNNYDCYVGGKLIQNTTQATFTIKFYINVGAYGGNASATIYIGDIYESSGTV